MCVIAVPDQTLHHGSLRVSEPASDEARQTCMCMSQQGGPALPPVALTCTGMSLVGVGVVGQGSTLQVCLDWRCCLRPEQAASLVHGRVKPVLCSNALCGFLAFSEVFGAESRHFSTIPRRICESPAKEIANLRRVVTPRC